MKGIIFTYALTYGGAAASFVNPWIGLLVYVTFAIIKPDALWYWSVPAGNYSRVIAMALLAGWALHGFGDWRFGRASGLMMALLGATLWAVLLSFGAANQELAWTYVENQFKIVLPLLMAVTWIRSVKQVIQLAWVIVLSQGYVAYDLNQAYYSGYNRMQDIGFGGLDNNACAITMDTCIGLAFFLGLHAPRWWQKAAAFGAAICMANCVMFSFSRGGLLGLICTGAVAFVLIPKRPGHYLVFAAAVAIGVRLAGAEVLERFGTVFLDAEARDRSASLRTLHWQACLNSMFSNPMGVGPHHWQYVAPNYGLPAMEAHSYWLQVGAELGLPGLAGAVVFYFGSMWRLWHIAKGKVSASDPWLMYLSQMVVASLVGFCISSQFVSVHGVETPYYVALVGLGVLKLISLGKLEKQSVSKDGVEFAG